MLKKFLSLVKNKLKENAVKLKYLNSDITKPKSIFSDCDQDMLNERVIAFNAKILYDDNSIQSFDMNYSDVLFAYQNRLTLRGMISMLEEEESYSLLHGKNIEDILSVDVLLEHSGTLRLKSEKYRN